MKWAAPTLSGFQVTGACSRCGWHLSSGDQAAANMPPITTEILDQPIGKIGLLALDSDTCCVGRAPPGPQCADESSWSHPPSDLLRCSLFGDWAR